MGRRGHPPLPWPMPTLPGRRRPSTRRAAAWDLGTWRVLHRTALRTFEAARVVEALRAPLLCPIDRGVVRPYARSTMTLARERGQDARSARRPMLLALVLAIFLVLVGITASALVAITSAHLSTATLNATISRDASLVELFVNSNLHPDDLVPGRADAAQRAQLDSKLAALTRNDQILRVDVRGANGEVLFASDPATVGDRPAQSQGMRDALSGTPSAAILASSNLRDPAVMALWRDAAPLLASVAQVQRDVVIVVLGAATVLAVILFLVFRAAQLRINRQQAQLLEATRRDPLTGLLNHGAVVASLAELVEGLRRESGSIGIALVDVDNFQLLNETHGHVSGDAVLRGVADLLDGEASGSVLAARYGPDEFLLVETAASATDLERRVADLRDQLADLTVQFGDSERLPVTVSVGIASLPEHAGSVTELLSQATVALQEAKGSGGDAVRTVAARRAKSNTGSFDVLQGLVIAVDTKDRYTKRHSEDVARYAVFLAEQLGLDAETLATIRVSGLLHDIGKIGIPDSLLRKPSKLTAQEFDIFKQHVALGDSIVRDLPNLEAIRAGIRHHHERWDGHGYLAGLEGEQIPLIGRIMAVADAFSAMTTTRPYRKALPVEEAIKRLGDAAGTQLEQGLVVAFIHGLETASDAPIPGDASRRIWKPARRAA
ncbi:MAG: diguanylate cyclase [Chloroflexi bacterium]|nr:MAG: diguanylate cyclase [Chloroflexota bacterium]